MRPSAMCPATFSSFPLDKLSTTRTRAPRSLRACASALENRGGCCGSGTQSADPGLGTFSVLLSQNTVATPLQQCCCGCVFQESQLTSQRYHYLRTDSGRSFRIADDHLADGAQQIGTAAVA